MPAWLRFLIYTAAVYRYTLLLHEEDGPWHIFTRIRAWLGVRHEIKPIGLTDAYGMGEYQEIIIAEGFWAELVNCPYCLSGWLSVIAAVGYVTRWKVLGSIALIGAIWAIPHYLYKRLGY